MSLRKSITSQNVTLYTFSGPQIKCLSFEAQISYRIETFMNILINVLSYSNTFLSCHKFYTVVVQM